MKLCTVVVLAALCATAVSAAPHTSPNFSFKEYALSSVFDGIGEKLKEHWVDVKCITDAIGKVVQESEIKGAWDKTKAKLDQLINVEWKKCSESTNPIEQAKCKAGVVEQAAKELRAFLQIVAAEANLELLKEIKDKIVTECLGNNVESAFGQFDGLLTEVFECIVNVLGDVSKANGLDELWSKSEPQLRQRLSNWKKCPNAGNKLLVLLCNLREGAATYRLVSEYVKLAVSEKPEIVQDLIQQIQERCSVQNELAEENNSVEEVNAIERIRCIIEATNDAVKETDFQKIWEEYKKDLEQLLERLKDCKNEASPWEQAKCVAREVQRSNEILRKFLASLKEANHETYVRVKKYIKQRCFA